MSDVIIYQGAAIPFSFSRQNGQPLDVTSVMRTLADITTYAANTEKKYVPYEGQTIACLEDKMLYILELKNGVLVPKLSGGVKLIKRDDKVELTDDAALSALRSVKEIEDRAISRTKRDRAAEVIEFAKGLTAANGKTTVSGDGKVTTLNLLVQALAEVYDLNVSHVATMMRTNIKDYVSSEAFTPGLLGEGFKISKALNGDWNLEIDNIVVRKVMTIFEMIISKVRSVNGGLVISDGNGRIKSVAETTGSPAYYVIGIEGDMRFVVDDYVRCQVFSNGHAKFYWVRVSSISGNSILVLKSEFTNGAVPAIGDDLVQMGNKTNKARQGLIYLTASEDGKPRISVMDGVNSTSLVGKNKVILGCLDGITDTDFPADFQPSGYGLYAMNVFLKGIFVLRNGKSVEGEIEAAQNAAATAQAKADTVTRLFQEFTVAGGLFESKITEVKEYADGKVNAVQVGGRNLIPNSSSVNASVASAPIILTSPLKPGISYIFTVESVSVSDYYVRVYPNVGAGWDDGVSVPIGTPFTVPSEMRLMHMYAGTGGVFTKSKLERGNKPTDWTLAPEDVAADAKAKADAAQAAAEAVAIAKATLAKTEASAYADGIVTAEEQRAIADAQAKLAEAKLDAQAKANDAKQAAIADAANKYPTKSEVTSSINQKADEIDLSITEKIESVQVGGRNYYKDSTNIAQVGESNVLVYKNKDDHGFTLVGSNPNQYPRSDCRMTNVITSNGYWTISFDLKGRQGALSTVDIDICDLGSKRFTMTSNNQWAHYEHTVNVTNWTAEVYNFVDFNSVAWDYFDFRNFKVEKGNKATDWTPAPEDAQFQITENSTNIGLNTKAIELRAKKEEVDTLTGRVVSAEGKLVVQSNEIAAQVGRVDSLTGRMSNAEFNLKPENIWLGIKSNVDASIPLYKTQVDTRSLDPNKYYLVTMNMTTTVPYTITVERELRGDYGVPPYSTHAAGFSVICKWQSNGSGWGGSNIKRIIQTLEYRFVGSCPVGSIGQISESSQEYVYVRGGSVYNIRVEGTSSTTVVLHTSEYFPYPAYPDSRRPSPIDSVVTPIVDLDQKVTEEQVKTGISIAPGIINVFGKQISLAGAVTFSSMASDAQGKINDAQNAANAAGAAAGTAQNTANKAITDAANAQLSATSANAAITNLTNSLGGLAYSDLVGLAKLDTTIIEGGYIKTNLINATAIVTSVLAATNVTATNLTVTGNSNIGGMVIKDGKLTGGSIVLETGARIGGMKVSGLALTNEGFNNDAYIILRNDNKGTFVGIGGDVMPAGVGTRATGRLECIGNDYGLSNTALVLRASGATGYGARNIALDMQGEIITRPGNGEGRTGKNLDFMISGVWVGSNKYDIILQVTNGLITSYRLQ